MTLKATAPILDDERLNTMQARASSVWRGDSLPKLQCAEDVLYLVAEVRRLRQDLNVSCDSASSSSTSKTTTVLRTKEHQKFWKTFHDLFSLMRQRT